MSQIERDSLISQLDNERTRNAHLQEELLKLRAREHDFLKIQAELSSSKMVREAKWAVVTGTTAVEGSACCQHALTPEGCSVGGPSHTGLGTDLAAERGAAARLAKRHRAQTGGAATDRRCARRQWRE